MARYIDADKVMDEINRIGGHNLCEWETIGVKALIDRQPTADVVPKSEIAREIFEEIEKYWIKSDILPDCVRLVDLDKIAELKKKYTEENK